MSIQERRERERAEREKLIIAAARELAETEGWDAVTTRRLAERVEYSQPVLYSHFDGKDAIKAAAPDPARALAAVSDAYMDFARRRPALYDAMFSQTVDLPFATAAAPPALHAGFGELAEALRPHANGDDLGLLTEVFWAALHGLATLTRGGRLPAGSHDRRLAILLARFVPAAGPGA